MVLKMEFNPFFNEKDFYVIKAHFEPLSLTLSLSSIALGKSSKLHPMSVQSCYR